MPVENIDNEKCIGCGICVQICPMDVFRMDEDSKKAITRYPEDCMLCELC
ncbi:ferredoxin family protein, partial [Thermodesulfobacteriota bacterium]